MPDTTRRLALRAAALLPLAALGLATVARAQPAAPQRHRLIIQVTDNDPDRWRMVLNNTRNAQTDVGGADKIELEIVAYGPGINMLKKESPEGERIAELAKSGVKFAACQNTMKGMKLTKDDMLTTVEYVSAGVTELMKKQEEGWSYIRP